MTIYTAIFSAYEDLKEPLLITPGWDYVCYTDQPFKSNVWRIVTDKSIGNPQLKARRYKLLQPMTGNSIWLDGSFTINTDLNQFWQQHFTAPFSCPSHPIRDCVFEECAACVFNKRGNTKDVQEQLKAYRLLKLPRHAGLISSGLLLRNDDAKEWCKRWFEELLRRSSRDQLAFAHTVWKHGAIHTPFKWDYRTAKDFIFTTHYHRRKHVIQ